MSTECINVLSDDASYHSLELLVRVTAYKRRRYYILLDLSKSTEKNELFFKVTGFV